MNKPTYKRRIVLVKRAFQFKYATIVLALFTVSAVIVWWEMVQSINGLYDRGFIADPEIMSMLRHIGKVVLIKLIIAQILVWFLAILLSHFIAGPMFRIEKSLTLLRDGDLTHRIFLRKHDQMESLASGFNETMNVLHDTIKEDRLKLDRAVKRLEEANAPADVISELKTVNKRFTI